MLRDIENQDKPKVTFQRRRRDTYHKIGFNPNHIPNQGKYDKVKAKKPRLEAWDNPKYDWPPRIPRATMHKGKTLLEHLDSEEKGKIVKDREFNIPDYRTGDVIEFKYLHSKSEGIEHTLSGVCYQTRKKNNLRAKAVINFNKEATNISMGFNLYSPMVTNMQIVKYGSNQLRNKLNHIPAMDFYPGRLQEPIIKGRNYRPRTGKIQKKETYKKVNDKGKIKKASFQMDNS